MYIRNNEGLNIKERKPLFHGYRERIAELIDSNKDSKAKINIRSEWNTDLDIVEMK